VAGSESEEARPVRRYVVYGGLLVAAMVGALIQSGPVGAEATGGRPFRLALSGAKEFNAAGVPINPHGDADRGSVVLTLNQGQEQVCWQFGPITMTAGEALPHVAHIHEAPEGFGGPVVVDLFGTAITPPAPTAYPTGTTCVHADADLIKDMRQNPEDYYINLHNVPHGGGVMRAQLSD
jgi:CHRD domain-containing protein